MHCFASLGSSIGLTSKIFGTVWNIRLLLSLLCTTKWILYGNIDDYKFCEKEKDDPLNVLYIWRKIISDLAKKPGICSLSTLCKRTQSFTWQKKLNIKNIINCQENKGFQTLRIDCFRPFVPFSMTFYVIWLFRLQSQMIGCACGMFGCIWWMYWCCLPIFVLFPVMRVPHRKALPSCWCRNVLFSSPFWFWWHCDSMVWILGVLWSSRWCSSLPGLWSYRLSALCCSAGCNVVLWFFLFVSGHCFNGWCSCEWWCKRLGLLRIVLWCFQGCLCPVWCSWLWCPCPRCRCILCSMLVCSCVAV